MARIAIRHHPHANQRAMTAEEDAYADNDIAGRPAVNVTRQRSYYGGFNIGAAFFGWIVASGIGVLLTAALVAAGSAVAVTSLQGTNAQSVLNSIDTSTAQTVGLVTGGLLLLALAVAYYAGGYVAGRMSRFDGARQGLGTWLIGLLAAIALGAAGAMFGARYNLLQGLNLPHLPVNQGSLTRGGLITSLLTLVVTLLAAISGGKIGERYHRKIDRVGRED